MSRDTTIFLLQHLGLVPSLKKYFLNPSTKMEFIWVVIDSISLKFQLTKTKMLSIIQKCQSLLKKEKVSIRKLSSTIGTLVSTAVAVVPAPPPTISISATTTDTVPSRTP